MNKTFQEADDLLFEIADELKEKGRGEVDVIICPPSPYLEMACDIASDNDFLGRCSECESVGNRCIHRGDICSYVAFHECNSLHCRAFRASYLLRGE